LHLFLSRLNSFSSSPYPRGPEPKYQLHVGFNAPGDEFHLGDDVDFSPILEIFNSVSPSFLSRLRHYWWEVRHYYTATHHDLWKLFSRKSRVKVLGGAHAPSRVVFGALAEDWRRG
jgi:hypothetical protein